MDIEKINDFFKYDLDIKKILNDLAPNQMDAYNEESCIEYSNRLFSALKEFKYYFTRIINMFDFNELDFINKTFEKYEQELLNSKYDFNKLSDFYKKNLSDMSIEFINNVNRNCIGYSYYNNISIMNESKTVNELLHFLHHYITNNEKFYGSIAEIDKKQNSEGYNIVLRGKETDISRNVFNALPYELSSGWTDIISLPNNKILLMVRDRGHALTIEISIENDQAIVRYFIPKVCNYLMVNSLKGVNKVSDSDLFTVGLFSCQLAKLPFEIYNLINSVPMDQDMFIEGGPCYQSSPKVI